MFSPQDPFMVPGSLQDQIIFPRRGPHVPAQPWELDQMPEILAALKRLGLGACAFVL